MARKHRKQTPTETQAPPSKSGIWGVVRYLYSRFWRILVAGFLLWLPLIITVWVSWWVLNKLVFGIERVIKSAVVNLHGLAEQTPQLGFLGNIKYQPGLGILLTLTIFLVSGYLARYLIGRKLIAFGERLLRFIPFFNRIYQAVVQIRDVFVSRQGTVFQRACLVDYPREGMTAVAFVTSSEQGTVQHRKGKELIAVFVPTTPNPTSGYLIYLPPEDITDLDMPVEEAMKLIVSGGAYLPSHHGWRPEDDLALPPENAPEPRQDPQTGTEDG
jgi:uncharacterized membrane protein